MSGRACRQGGLTLVELMVSIGIGLMLILAASALLLSAQRSYMVQDDAARLDESGRFALELISRAVRQAGFVNRGDNATAATLPATPSILGLDGSTVGRDTPAIESAQGAALNHSDLLGVRYFGSGAAQGDGSVLNCAGFSVPDSTDMSYDGRAWSIFYVAQDSGGEAQLYCKYAGRNGWTSDAVVRGVETLQVLYGVDGDDDGLPERMLSAQALGPHPEGRAEMRASPWGKVVSVRIALLMRGEGNSREGDEDRIHEPFGKDYADRHGAMDAGARLADSSLGTGFRKRMRKVFSTTVHLRNPSTGEPH